MKLGMVVRSFVSGCVVYVFAAACAAADTEHGAADAGAMTSSSSSGSAGTSSSSGVGGSLIDAITSPVPPAKAAEVATEPCNKTAATTTYAERLFPGKTAAQLASVVALVPVNTDIPGYNQIIVSSLFVRDGAVAVGCNRSTSVTFVLP